MSRIGKAMMINKKRFVIVGSRSTKREADQWADRLRNSGNLARVTKYEGGYYIWRGPRRSR